MEPGANIHSGRLNLKKRCERTCMPTAISYRSGEGSGYPDALKLRMSGHMGVTFWRPEDRWLFCHRDEKLHLPSEAWRQKLQIKRSVCRALVNYSYPGVEDHALKGQVCNQH